MYLYSKSNRFKNTPCPNRHALVSIFGQVIGKDTVAQNLAIMVDDITFLSIKGNKNDEHKDVLGQKSTIASKRKCDGWGNKYAGKRKKNKESSIASPIPSTDSRQRTSTPVSSSTIVCSPISNL